MIVRILSLAALLPLIGLLFAAIKRPPHRRRWSASGDDRAGYLEVRGK